MVGRSPGALGRVPLPGERRRVDAPSAPLSRALARRRDPKHNVCPLGPPGGGAVRVDSRIQMALFKARAKAKEEYEKALAETGGEAAPGGKPKTYPHYPRHVVVGTAANAVFEQHGNR